MKYFKELESIGVIYKVDEKNNTWYVRHKLWTDWDKLLCPPPTHLSHMEWVEITEAEAFIEVL